MFYGFQSLVISNQPVDAAVVVAVLVAGASNIDPDELPNVEVPLVACPDKAAKPKAI